MKGQKSQNLLHLELLLKNVSKMSNLFQIIPKGAYFEDKISEIGQIKNMN